uniref:Uncharacterized protein n=1 Tax=viral metagenome TaxID=1070528 RepID=A0A6M3Y3R9_9ZZZZ
MALAVGTAITALGIAKEEWDQLPASKKARIRKALEEKDIGKAKRIYANPCSLKMKETKHAIYLKWGKGRFKFKKPKWTREKVKNWIKKRSLRESEAKERRKR